MLLGGNGNEHWWPSISCQGGHYENFSRTTLTQLKLISHFFSNLNSKFIFKFFEDAKFIDKGGHALFFSE